MPAPQASPSQQTKPQGQLVQQAHLKEGGLQIPQYGILLAVDADRHDATMTMEPYGLRVEMHGKVLVIPYAHIKTMVLA